MSARPCLVSLVVLACLIAGVIWLIRAPTVNRSFGRKLHATGQARMLRFALGDYERKCGTLSSKPAPESSGTIYATGPRQNVKFRDLRPDAVSPAGEYLDPWRHPFVFRVSGDDYLVLSAGPDGRLGTADDISSDD